MVTLKSSKAIGSFLGTGTHVWLEINTQDGRKITFSGSKMGDMLGVIKNYKRDYDKPPHRGVIVIPPPEGVTENEWDDIIIEAGDRVRDSLHKKLSFSGPFPNHTVRGNCCTIVNAIIEVAGGCIPYKKLRGFTPGLKMSCPKLMSA